MFDPLQNVEETTSKRSRTTKKAKQRFFFGGMCSFDLTSIVSTINNRHGDLFLEPPENGWKDQVYFVKQLLHHQRDLGGPLLYRAKAWQAETIFTKVDDFFQ